MKTKNRMLKLGMAMSIGCLMAVGVSGCANYLVRTGDENVRSRLGVDLPYACAPYPYLCTAEMWKPVSLYSFRHPRPDCCGMPGALEIEFWPLFAVNEVCEVALDTIFLPVDLTYLLVKEDGEGESTPASSGDVSP
ncbi:MAG: hypothetical protein IKQ17_05320 [Kiritimatiellae bacterium]|nr:hypothetical protein [Kiritimatiellia bacterium]